MSGILVVVEPDEGSTVVEVESGGERGPQGETGQQGPIGLPGGRVTVTAGQEIPFLHVVRLGADELAYLASSSDDAGVWRVLGVAEHNALPGEPLTVVQAGTFVPGSPFPLGPLFLDVDGAMTPNPNTGVLQLHVADALSNDLVNVRLEPAIHH